MEQTILINNVLIFDGKNEKLTKGNVQIEGRHIQKISPQPLEATGAITRAIHAGVKSIEHGHLIDEPTMQLIAQKDIWLCVQPFTLEDNQYPTEQQQAKHRRIVEGTDNTYRLARKYQVKLAWGTDLLFNPAHTQNENKGILKLQKWFSNFEILKMVTHDNARLLALSGSRNPYPAKLGVVEEGAAADLLLVNGNAMEDLTLLGNPEENLLLIMKDGRIYKDATGRQHPLTTR